MFLNKLCSSVGTASGHSPRPQGKLTERLLGNERVCGFCRGQPADPYLILLDKVVYAVAHDRLIEDSCVVYLDHDVVEQSLAPLVWTGCLTGAAGAVRPMATLVENGHSRRII